jgi:cytochrome c-type biogenesis protein CcmH/NrfG
MLAKTIAEDVSKLLLQAQAAEARSDTSAALVAYERVLVLDPENPGALLRVAQAQLQSSPNDSAIMWLQRACVSACAWIGQSEFANP